MKNKHEILRCMAVLYQVLNKQVPVPVQVPVVQVPVQVLCINYWHSVTLQLHKVKVVASFIILCKKRTVRTPVNFKHRVW